MRTAQFTLILVFMSLLLSSFRDCPTRFGQDIVGEERDTITWYSFNEGHAKAVRENKILLVNISTTHCYPCKLMFKYTYTHQGVIDTLNKCFVCVYFNPDIDTSYMLNGNKIGPKELIKYLFVDDPQWIHGAAYLFEVASRRPRYTSV